ncbi:MAG: hypothetical protein GY862_37805 [Gammaproteobacteria bacterium]|nr:hypothetical protein [Gammaproteobacteria bacterium]
MDDALFNELIESVQEAGQIMRGEKSASRTFESSVSAKIEPVVFTGRVPNVQKAHCENRTRLNFS